MEEPYFRIPSLNQSHAKNGVGRADVGSKSVFGVFLANYSIHGAEASDRRSSVVLVRAVA